MTNLKMLWFVLVLIVKALWLFLAVMAPLMFLVGVIVAFDQASQHRRLLDNLQTYGAVTSGNISYVSLEDNRAGVAFVRSDGSEFYASLNLKHYPETVAQSLAPGQVLLIYYIDELVSGWDEAVLAEYYDHAQAYFPISPETMWIMGICFLIIAIQPQVVFWGFGDFDEIMQNLFGIPGKS
ncbi:MAG: hypothetical protein R6W69_02205 [Anaerolineales bacterium]